MELSHQQSAPEPVAGTGNTPQSGDPFVEHAGPQFIPGPIRGGIPRPNSHPVPESTRGPLLGPSLGDSTPTVARTTDEVERLRSVWARMPVTHVDCDLDYFLTVVRNEPRVLGPHVVHIARATGDLLVLARLVDGGFPVRVGHRTLGCPRARSIVVSFNGILGARTEADLAEALAVLRHQLHEGEADVVVLQKLDTAGRVFRHVERVRPRHLVRPEVVSWSADLPGSWEDLLALRAAKSRRQIRYDDNKLRRTYGDRLGLRRLDLPEHRGRLLDDMRAVAAGSYQRGLGVSVVDSPLQVALIETAHRHGWLRVWMLYLDDRPVAFWWGIVRGRTLSIGSPGFLPEFAKDRVGYYTLRRLLEDACTDPDVSTVDFGPGDADYKERFGTRRTEVADVLLFAGRVRPVLLHAMLTAQDRGLALLRAAAQRTGQERALRQRLRSRGLQNAERSGG